jgi:hypothetical protein
MNTEKPATVRFQDNEVHDFYTALEVYSEQYHDELQVTRDILKKYGANDKDRQDLENQRKGVEHLDKMMEVAREIYDEAVKPAIKIAVARMRAVGDSDLNEIASALESGDYSRLAL